MVIQQNTTLKNQTINELLEKLKKEIENMKHNKGFTDDMFEGFGHAMDIIKNEKDEDYLR